MTMVSIVYKTQNPKDFISDHAIVNFLVDGFTGQLKGWWNHALPKTQQEEILKAIKKDDQGKIILDEKGREIQYTVATLIFSFSKHFIEDPSHPKDRNSRLLSNLKCKKIKDFKWYKNVFMTRVVHRSDNQQPFWKENFLAGLPSLLREKVRNQIKENYKGIIPYEKLTYGELISFTQKERLKICQDLKSQK
uniref:DUF7746 domain-containing protein n=1 Tax=Gossypium raimondii TaxID=29730 RepID=A0A0D2SCJ5_GOSRA|nr:hypothetical protein B456_009G331100 [Gossypium raimondii]